MTRSGKQIARKSTGPLPAQDQVSSESALSPSHSATDDYSTLTENVQVNITCEEDDARQVLEQRLDEYLQNIVQLESKLDEQTQNINDLTTKLDEKSQNIDDLTSELEEITDSLSLARAKNSETQLKNQALELENKHLKNQFWQIRRSLMEVCLEIPD